MTTRRAFASFLASGVMGLALARPSLSRRPALPERPPTTVERAVCDRCGLDSDSIEVQPHDSKHRKAARFATMVIRSHTAVSIARMECPLCSSKIFMSLDFDPFGSPTIGEWQ